MLKAEFTKKWGSGRERELQKWIKRMCGRTKDKLETLRHLPFGGRKIHPSEREKAKKLAESLTQKKKGSRGEEGFVGKKINSIARSTICIRHAVSVKENHRFSVTWAFLERLWKKGKNYRRESQVVLVCLS